LVILGCREKDLPRGRALKLEDLTPLHAVVQTKSDAASILRALEAVKLRVGSIKGVCSDECSNTGTSFIDYDPENTEKHLGWLRQFEGPIKYYANLVELAGIARHLVREKGIHRYIADDFIIEFENASPEEGWDVVTTRTADQVYEFLEEQGNKIEKGRIFLGSSEVIETFFGKYKSIQGNQTKAGFSGLVLAGLAHIGTIDKSIVQDALETVTHTQVNDWVEKYVGVTVHAKRCKVFRKPKKCIKLLFQKISEFVGRESAGTNTDRAVGF
jgi:hypothetical protein